MNIHRKGSRGWNSTEVGDGGVGVCSRTNFMAIRNCDLTSVYFFPMVSLELVISLRSQGQAPGELSGGVLGVFWRHRGRENVSRRGGGSLGCCRRCSTETSCLHIILVAGRGKMGASGGERRGKLYNTEVSLVLVI